jgi:hypothetical protein
MIFFISKISFRKNILYGPRRSGPQAADPCNRGKIYRKRFRKTAYNLVARNIIGCMKNIVNTEIRENVRILQNAQIHQTSDDDNKEAA